MAPCRCPAGQALTKRGYNKQENGWTYRARREVCHHCQLRNRCFHASNPNYTRMIVRYVGTKPSSVDGRNR